MDFDWNGSEWRCGCKIFHYFVLRFTLLCGSLRSMHTTRGILSSISIRKRLAAGLCPDPLGA